MDLRSFSVYDIFKRNARLFKDSDGVVAGDLRLSFKNVLSRADGLAAGFVKEGMEKGDRICILSQNRVGFFDIFGAAAKTGGIVVPINWRLSLDEIRYILEDCRPKILVTDAEHGARIREMEKSVLSGLKWFQFEESGEIAEPFQRMFVAEHTEAVKIEPDDPFCIIYTAAVEGKPRGAVLSHENIVAANIQILFNMAMTPADACLNMIPLFHITGLNLALSVMHAGGKNVVVNRFEEKSVVELTDKENITVLGSFPPILSRLTEEIQRQNTGVPSLRHVLGLDQPDNIRPFEELTNAKFWMLYGQTETSGMVTFSPAMERPGSAGREGILSRFTLFGDDEKEVATGETGEIVVKGPVVFKGFWEKDEINRVTFREGWHHTGDLGRLDEDGYLWYAGRKPEKELIKPGGENVYPAEVEDVILQHPDVLEVSVIGVPDPKFGEGVKAVCVLKEGASLTDTGLKSFVGGKIAGYKKPGYVEFVSELPKTKEGIIDRTRVKELYGKD